MGVRGGSLTDGKVLIQLGQVSVAVWFSSKKAPLAAVEVRDGCSCHASEIKGRGGGHVRLGYIKILGHIS